MMADTGSSARQDEITLFDLPSRPPGGCWSLNPWKTRMALNYKGLAYKTIWVEYPDVQPLLKPHLPPNPSGIPYTIPTIRLQTEDGDGEWIMGSLPIARRLEEIAPEPSLGLESVCVAAVTDLAEAIMQEICVDFIPKIPNRILGEASQEYWYRSREEWFGGMALDELEKQKGGDAVYDAVRPLVVKLEVLLTRDSSGPFFKGQTVTYADFIWAGFLRFYERLGDDVFQKLIASDPEAHLSLLTACRPWMQRHSY